MFKIEILTNYSFIIVALATFLLAMVSGAVGCINVLKGQSLIGDTIGHASFPGIILAFIFFLSREPYVLFLGAVFSGALAFILIQVVNNNSKLDLNAILAIVLSSFFGAGMVLKTYIQGNKKFLSANQSGLQNYIFGQAAYIMKSDMYLIIAVVIPIILLLILFFKELKVFIFDEIYSKTIGLNTTFLNGLILIMTMSLIAVGLKLVGAILISSLLIIPAITALQWSNKFHKVIIISALFGGISALIGTYISTAYSGMSTGPTIILVMCLFAFLSLVIGPHGMLNNIRIRRRYK